MASSNRGSARSSAPPAHPSGRSAPAWSRAKALVPPTTTTDGSPVSSREHEVLEAVERRRRLKPKLKDERVTLAHGAGGKATRVLVEALFVDRFGTPTGDAAVFEQDDTRLAESMAEAAQRADVTIAAGDTKVVERGKADGVYVNTAGIGVLERPLELSPAGVKPGDRILVSGTIGDHGMAVMIARGELQLEVDLESDTAPLAALVASLLDATDGVRWLRDPTRGGLATVLNELALEANVAVRVDESALPIRPEVVGACEILGIDPLYVANEGKLVAIVAPDATDDALAALHPHPLGADAALV